MIRCAVAFAALALAVSPSFGATHVWEGSVSGQFSNGANWIGGSPAGDPNAELSFPWSAQRTALVNDIPNLTVRTIAFSGDGFTIGGNAITLLNGNVVSAWFGANQTISCDLVLSGPATFVSFGNLNEDHGITFSGAISGSGSVAKSGNGRITYAGAASNTYTGETLVSGGELRLDKPANVTAIRGDLRVVSTNVTVTELAVAASEQIADTATIRAGVYTALRFRETETIGPLVLTYGAQIYGWLRDGGSNTGTLMLGGNIDVVAGGSGSARLHLRTLLPTTRTITIGSDRHSGGLRIDRLDSAAPGAGVIVRAESPASEVLLSGGYTGPTVIEGAAVNLTSGLSAVTLRSGRFTGRAPSLVSGNGRAHLASATISGELRFDAAATAAFELTDSIPPWVSATQVTLGNAALELMIATLPKTPNKTHVLIDNKGTQAVSGTFAGLPEGAIHQGRFRITYQGGDGNNVVATDVSRFESGISLDAGGQLMLGQPAALTATVAVVNGTGAAPTGTVTFLDGATVLGAATLDASGRATANVTPSTAGVRTFTARYEGNATTEPTQTSEQVRIIYAPPTLTAVEPATVTAGQTVEVIVRGTGFVDGSTIGIASTIYRSTFVSPAELRLSWTVPATYVENATAKVWVTPPDGVRPSNELSMQITGVPRAASGLTFESQAVNGPVTAGASSYWLRGSAVADIEYGIVTDADGDGAVRWALAKPIPGPTIVFMVDGSSGAFRVSDPLGKVPFTERWAPRTLLLRDTAGAYSHIVTFNAHHTMLWVRPNVGAWTLTVPRLSPADHDPTKRLIANTSAMQPLTGSPAPPAGVLPGDTFLVLVDFWKSWYGGRAADFMGSGGGVVAIDNGGAYETEGVVRLTVARTGGSEGVAAVSFTTVDGNAVAGVHYQATAGTVTFGDGEILKTINVPLINDTTYGGTGLEFRVRLTGATGATIGEADEATVILFEDDPWPALALGPDVSVLEGDSGVHQVPVTLTLTGSTRLPVNVIVTVSANGSDTSTPMTFAPGETTKTIIATYTANTTLEDDRRIGILASPFASQATATRSAATITIRDDDPHVGVTVLDQTVDETEQVARIRVVATSDSPRVISLRYTTVAGSAAAGADFTTTTGTLNFSSEDEIELPILADTAGEGLEWFSVVLHDPVNATLRRTAATVIIHDDDPISPPLRGDFNRDGHPDLFWSHTSGAAYVWNLHGLTLIGSGNASGPGAGWRAAAINDFDRDGDADVVWQNAQGVNQLWFMNGNSLASTVSVPQAGLVEWRIVATADFDRDGNADLLWQHDTTAQLYVWYMNGAELLRGANMNNVGNPDWRVAAVIDGDASSWPRILWRHRTTGQNYMWFLRDNLLTEGANVQYVPDTAWQIVAAHRGGESGDYVFWQHTSGALYYWKMNGAATIESGNFNGNGGNGWHVAGPR